MPWLSPPSSSLRQATERAGGDECYSLSINDLDNRYSFAVNVV